MKTFDISLNSFGGGIDSISEIVIAETTFDAAIAVLEKLKEKSRQAQSETNNVEWTAETCFELRSFVRHTPTIL